MLVWSDIPNNRMMKLIDGQVSEFLKPSNFCNGNAIDNDENLISCSHCGRCIYKTDDLEFGGKEGNTLYVTATSSLYAMELNQTGAKFPI